MEDEVRRLDHAMNRTFGTETIYETYGGLMPRDLIAQTIRRIRSEIHRGDWWRALRYEFTAVDAVWSVDFLQVGAAGRIMRVQEERSRYVLLHEYRVSWSEAAAAREGYRLMIARGRPLALKHDLGPEFKSGVFQSMLRGLGVISLPNPPYWPRSNGKLERGNRDTRQWEIPFTDVPRTTEDHVREIGRGIHVHNTIRPRKILGWRTPEQAYTTGRRADVNREEVYAQWEARRERLKVKKTGGCGTIRRPDDDFSAMRLAALAVLQERGLLRYFHGRGGLKVSGEFPPKVSD
jgi:hypothetical protein